jgi:hypothetical protein
VGRHAEVELEIGLTGLGSCIRDELMKVDETEVILEVGKYLAVK